ncbi:Hypp8667 [Branchiostoma lanceolatum]|uniref:Hypp8667 protein n=1 Tax=Branchiostoma lanceolatum TaxID=7740 RepID=A0A8J9Z8E9_BRALA|nr:Hypp8667 [Branchiostoma lanceolatum]
MLLRLCFIMGKHKRVRMCPGCGQDLTLHPGGKGNKNCTGLPPPAPTKEPVDAQHVPNPPLVSPPVQNPAQGASAAEPTTAELEDRKKELTDKLARVQLAREVALLEAELQKAQLGLAALPATRNKYLKTET